MISKCLLAIATVANAFMPKSHAFIIHAPMHMHNKMCFPLRMKHSNNDSKNTSKIYRMDFSEDDELENFLKPRYAFGLSEYHMTLMRIYVYMVITLQIITYVVFKQFITPS
jgi:hypothetical protein